jgi:hypothetical protein
MSEEKVGPFDPQAVDAVGELAWAIADEFVKAFDELLVEMAQPDAKEPEVAKTAGSS